MHVRQNAWMGSTVIAGLCVALAAGCSPADQETEGDFPEQMGTEADTGADARPGAQMGAADAQIVGEVSAANALEIGTSNLAQEKAQSEEVRSFARDMISDHRQMQIEVQRVVDRDPQLQSGTPPDTMHVTQALQQLQDQPAGPEFDRMYMDMQVQAHESTLEMLNRARTQAQVAELGNVIQQAIPKVQQHLERARQIRTELGG